MTKAINDATLNKAGDWYGIKKVDSLLLRIS